MVATIEPKFLICVKGYTNNNKFYKMIPNPDGQSFTAIYGRVGETGTKMQYSMSKWNIVYNQRLRHGYEDRSSEHQEVVPNKDAAAEPEFLPIPDEEIQEMIEYLQACARAVVRANYRVKSIEVTKKMVVLAQRQIDHMSRMNPTTLDELNDFNDELLALFRIIPRKMRQVSSYLAQTVDDAQKIMVREQELLDVMAGQVAQNAPEPTEKKKTPTKPETILEHMGLTIKKASKTDITRIKKLLGKDANRFHAAWKVVNKRTQRAFDAFMKEQGDIETKLLWHGSKNENWLSIMNSGLVLRPNAAITGKMFGAGIYFAPKADKSIRYTSIQGSYWAHGTSNRAFLALFKVAYGTPYVVDNNRGISSSFGYADLQRRMPGAHCLHALAGNYLRNDEIIFYKEEQVTIQYLVEIR